MNDKDIKVKQWLIKASEDYGAYVKLMQPPDPLTDSAAFHAQQAAEKWLKGLLVLHEKTAPKVHDLISLLHLLKAYYPELENTIWLTRGNSLTDFAVDIRYPDYYEEADIKAAYPEEVAML